MIKRMRSGWYVVASVDHWRNYLCGPFQTQRAAVDMIEQASREGLPPGSLKLDHNYVRETLAVRSWASVFSDKRRTAGGWVDN
jgi:hypothetical protein